MVNWIINIGVKIGLKFVSYKTLVKTIATALAYLIEYARKNSSKDGWDKAKQSIKIVRNWLNLFDEIYEDDTLTPEEEKKIQDAISNCTATESIYNLLQGNPNGTPIKKNYVK